MKRFLLVAFIFTALFDSSLGWCAGTGKYAELMAVFIEADWCANCKVLQPKLQDAYKGFERKINLVNLDVTR